ncbi:MAG: hypothetical protein MZV64_64475 [Ignavibacteriales bacterium]|nr:hypothetical protein [Ignavibacteriales bacterium]
MAVAADARAARPARRSYAVADDPPLAHAAAAGRRRAVRSITLGDVAAASSSPSRRLRERAGPGSAPRPLPEAGQRAAGTRRGPTRSRGRADAQGDPGRRGAPGRATPLERLAQLGRGRSVPEREILDGVRGARWIALELEQRVGEPLRAAAARPSAVTVWSTDVEEGAVARCRPSGLATSSRLRNDDARPGPGGPPCDDRGEPWTWARALLRVAIERSASIAPAAAIAAGWPPEARALERSPGGTCSRSMPRAPSPRSNSASS